MSRDCGVRRPREDMLQGKKSSSSSIPGLRLNRVSIKRPASAATLACPLPGMNLFAVRSAIYPLLLPTSERAPSLLPFPHL